MKPFSALLLSADPGSLAVTQKILEEYGVSVQIAGSAVAADQLIRKSMFDLGIFDNDVPGALDLASGCAGSSNPKMVFALVRAAAWHDVRGKRVQFVVQKPFTADLFARSLRAAYGTMVRERRLAFRHPVGIKPDSSVLLQERGDQPLHSTSILDLSQTGMCIQTMEILPQGAALKINFHLPESREVIHVTGTVMWTRASGRTGIKFTHVPAVEQKHLVEWLDSRLPYEIGTISRAVPASIHRERVAELRT
jgi:CheY-like chemotaxis protein